jgi:ribosomal protein S18 acetylase RimI-like enzyme
MDIESASGEITVRPVLNSKDKKAFVRFPKTLYDSDPQWVPPLWRDEMNGYDKRNNPILSNADYILCIAERNGEVVGRNLIYVDNAFNDFNKSRTGFFGAFESVNDRDTAEALMDTAEKWLAERGMEAVRGPIHPTAEIWGFLNEGFDRPPIYMSPYNPPYYNTLMNDLGYNRVMDLLVYEADGEKDYRLPERYARFAEHFLDRHPEIRVRKLNPKRLEEEADNVWRISNAAYVGNWGYVPVDKRVVEDMVNKLKPIIDADAIWFVEDTSRLKSDKVIGYALGFPDINPTVQRIGGRLFPFGFMRFMRGVRKERNYRLFGLAVLPRYQGMGLDVLLYVKLFQALKPKGVRLEANYILENNYRIRNALEKLEMVQTKRYRIYEKPIV